MARKLAGTRKSRLKSCVQTGMWIQKPVLEKFKKKCAEMNVSVGERVQKLMERDLKCQK